MASTPSNSRLMLTPSNSPFLRPSKSLTRGRPSLQESRLSLKRVVGTTCRSPTGFDTVNSLFAYVAGGAVVVVDVQGAHYSQRFYRARPAAVPVYSVASAQNAFAAGTSTPKANDSRNRVAPHYRDSPYSPAEWTESPGSKTWTSRERIKAATCLALSRDGKYLAVGETGYAPRVLIFNLQDASSDTPLVSISEHAFGVNAVAWSADGKYLASLGAANDGFLYIWKIDPRTGAAKLFQQNKCTANVREMIWLGNNLITMGVRHIKVWKVDDGQAGLSGKQKLSTETTLNLPIAQRPLPGRNMLLGDLLDATFSCAAVDGARLILCTESGDVCFLDDDEKHMKLVRALSLDFPVTTINIRGKVAYIGGKDGHFVTIDLADLSDDDCCGSILSAGEAPAGIVALGFLSEMLVTIDSKQSIDLWTPDYIPGQRAKAVAHIPMPGHREPIAGVQALRKPNKASAAFVTWSHSGNFTFWDLDGQVKSCVEVPVDAPELDSAPDLANKITCARTSGDGKLLVTADNLGILKITDADSKECVLDTKAHSSDCISICIYDEEPRFLMACCGRDRTTQLFHRLSNGIIDHFQTLEFPAKVVQVLIPTEDKVITCSLDRTLQIFDLVSKHGNPDVCAAIPSKVISLRSSPTSMAMGQDNSTIYVSLLDRSVYQFDIATGRQLSYFKCVDENGAESTILESLTVGPWAPKDVELLLGSSNTDKSVRIYDAASGTFLDREWGHTEAINGVCLLDDDDGSRKIVSVGSDGTIMIWGLDTSETSPRLTSRDPSPVKETTSARPTLRKVLSKVELAEFQRPTSSGRRSPPRSVQRRSSRLNLSNGSGSVRTPTSALQGSPSTNSTIMEDTPSRRRLSNDNEVESPPPSPKTKRCRNYSSSTLGKASRKKASTSSLHSFGSLNMATEQACRTLRAYRKKLSSAEPITTDVLTELDHELRLTATALGDRASRSKAIDETVLTGLLDQYSERIVTMLDEKLRLSHRAEGRDDECLGQDRRRSLTGSTTSSSSSSSPRRSF